jgi:hypothetical protein
VVSSSRRRRSHAISHWKLELSFVSGPQVTGAAAGAGGGRGTVLQKEVTTSAWQELRL